MQKTPLIPASAFVAGSPQFGFDTARLWAPEQAIIGYLARVAVAPRGVERVSLDAASGRVLAEDAVATADHPAHPRSTMDGFAVASSDGAARRRLAGDVLMGQAPPRKLGAGEAIRVPTGGAIPAGADAVIPQEDVVCEGETITSREAPQPGAYITARGEDLKAGDVVLDAGRRLGAPELGVLAALGAATVPVYVRPRVGIVSTGDELVDVSAVPAAGQIRDSNRYALAAALAALGAEPVFGPRAVDEPDALREALRQMLSDCDALVTTGGSSVGARDLVPSIVAELGEPGPIVHGLRVKPGKPTLLAAVGEKPIIGLPGNPASSLMILEAVVRPIVVALTGERGARPHSLSAIARAPFAGRTGWTWYVPARVHLAGARLEAKPLPLRSAQTSLLARASGYVTIGENVARIEAGEPVTVTLFSCGGAPLESE